MEKVKNVHINEIEAYFNTNGVPTDPVQLDPEDPATVVTNPEKFVSHHLSVLKNNPGNMRFKPYYDRLVEFYLLDKE
jgi:hypothetical protein